MGIYENAKRWLWCVQTEEVERKGGIKMARRKRLRKNLSKRETWKTSSQYYSPLTGKYRTNIGNFLSIMHFNGLSYKLKTIKSSKNAANKIKEEYTNRQYSVRIVKHRKLWGVYVRKKDK